MSETRPSKPMQLVAERVLPDPPSISSPPPIPTITPPSVNLQQEFIQRAAWKAGVLGALNLAAMVLAVRLILLIAVAGAIALTWAALATQDLIRIGAVGLYTLTVVVPMIWLSGRR